MFRRKPQWLKTSEHIINLDTVEHFTRQDQNSVVAFFSNPNTPPVILNGINLVEVNHFLKYGKPRR